MSDNDLRRYTLEELREKLARGESQTDWARVNAMTDEDIERAIAEDPDSDLPDVEWHRALAIKPGAAAGMPNLLEPEVIHWLFALDQDGLRRVNDLLRAYMCDHSAAKAAE